MLVCTGYSCPRRNECGKCVDNLNSKYKNKFDTVINFAITGRCSSTSFTHTDITRDCGPAGNYRMFEEKEIINEFKDKLGNLLCVGDKVVFVAPGCRKLVIGTVTSFSKKMITIEYVNDWNYSNGCICTLRQTPDLVVKIKE